MKRKLFCLIMGIISIMGVNAQVRIESPHPDLDIKVKRCAYASGTVVIDMVITNYGADANLILRSESTSLYDDEGNQYTWENSDLLMGLTSQGVRFCGSSHSTFSFPQDIPLKFRVQVSKITPNASMLKLVKMCVYSDELAIKDKYINIRNLPISK